MGAPQLNGPFTMPMFRAFVPRKIQPWIYRYGFTNDDFQLHGQVDNRSRREATICPKVRIVILYEGEGQCRKRDIRQVVLFPHEPFHMVVGVPIASQTAFGPVYTHALREVLNKRAEVAQ